MVLLDGSSLRFKAIWGLRSGVGPRVGWPDVGHKLFSPQEAVPYLWDPSPWWAAVLGGGVFGEIVSLLLLPILMRPFYPLQSSCLASSQVLFRGNYSVYAADLLDPGRRRCSQPSYAGTLNHLPFWVCSSSSSLGTNILEGRYLVCFLYHCIPSTPRPFLAHSWRSIITSVSN